MECLECGFFNQRGQKVDYLSHKNKTSCHIPEVEIDTLSGDWKILHSSMVVDIGKPINPAIDLGQIEGAFMQGHY